jgi:hypothetical protein
MRFVFRCAVASGLGIRLAHVAQLGIELRYCRPGSPNLKGKIERLFGAVARKFCAPFPGRSFANPQAKGDYRAKIPVPKSGLWYPSGEGRLAALLAPFPN